MKREIKFRVWDGNIAEAVSPVYSLIKALR